MIKKILLIDDDPMIIRTVDNLLKRDGYEISLCSSGQEAIEAVKKQSFDLLVVDIRMPKIDGVETARQIKQSLKQGGHSQNIPIVFITGYMDLDHCVEAGQLGKVLFKPFDMLDFLGVVRKEIQ